MSKTARDKMSYEEEASFVAKCFEAYENEGFAKLFWTPYGDHAQYKNQPFEVISRQTTEDYDRCVLPVWRIKIRDGEEISAYPEEIVLSEMINNGYRLEN